MPAIVLTSAMVGTPGINSHALLKPSIPLKFGVSSSNSDPPSCEVPAERADRDRAAAIALAERDTEGVTVLRLDAADATVNAACRSPGAVTPSGSRNTFAWSRWQTDGTPVCIRLLAVSSPTVMVVHVACGARPRP